MLVRISSSIGFALICGLFVSPALAGSYTYTPITLPQPAAVLPLQLAMNNNDQVAGYFSDTQSNHVVHGFIWSNGSSTQVDQGSFGTYLSAINDSGVAVGYFAYVDFGVGDAFSYDFNGGTYSTLRVGNNTKNYSWSWATAVNNSGAIAGWVKKNNKPAASLRAFVIPPGGAAQYFKGPGATATQPNGMSDDGTIVGGFDVVSHEARSPRRIIKSHCFIYQAGTVTQFDVPSSSPPYCTINPDGTIFGNVTDGAGNSSGFTYVGGETTIIQFPGAQSTSVASVRADGTITGSWTANHQNHGFVRVGGTHHTIDVPGSAGTLVFASNANGSLAGFYAGSPNSYFIAQCPTNQRPCTK